MLGHEILKIMRKNKIPKEKTAYLGKLGHRKIDWSSSDGYETIWKGKYKNGDKYQTIGMKGFQHKIPKIMRDINKIESLSATTDGYYITIVERKIY